MRTIIKNITIPVDGETKSFRLKKLDAFSGVSLLRLVLRRLPEMEKEGTPHDPSLLEAVFLSLSDSELRGVMRDCLNHTEVLLDAGYHPVMMGSDWGYPELEHDAAACLKLTLEGIAWTLSDFFPAAGSASPADRPAS